MIKKQAAISQEEIEMLSDLCLIMGLSYHRKEEWRLAGKHIKDSRDIVLIQHRKLGEMLKKSILKKF